MFWLIEQTNLCNYRCPCCPNPQHNRPRGRMDRALFEQIVDELAIHGFQRDRVAFHGFGEPLLHPELMDRLEHLTATGFRNVDLTTNGSLLNPERAAELVKRAGCLSWARVSLNSTRKPVMERINEGANFETVVANTGNFLDVVAAAGHPFNVWIQLMQTQSNVGEGQEDVYQLFGRVTKSFSRNAFCFAAFCACTIAEKIPSRAFPNTCFFVSS